MDNEININGDDNIVISEVVGSRITVNKFLGDSKDYQEKVTYLDDKKKLLSRTPEDEPEERARLFKEIAELEDQLKSLRQGVINLAKTFKALEEKPEININNTRLEKAKEHFVAGRFTEARTILEQEIEAINDEGKVLLGHKADFEEKKAEFEKEAGWYKENVQPQLEYKAYEYLFLALITGLNYESPTRQVDAHSYFKSSIECVYTYENLDTYAQFLWKHSYFQEAAEYWQKALDFARSRGDKIGESCCLGNLGTAFNSLCDYKKAISFYERSLEISDSKVDRSGNGAVLTNLGLAYYNIGEFRKAETFSKEALKIFRETKEESSEAETLTNLGLIYHSLGEHKKALNFHKDSLQMKKKVNDLHGIANCLGNVGAGYLYLEEFEKAIEYNKEALKIAQNIGNRYIESNQLGNLGYIHFFLGESEKAVQFYKRGLKISQETGNRLGEGRSYVNLAAIYVKKKDFKTACKYWKLALTIYEDIGAPTTEIIRNLIRESGCPEENPEGSN